VKYGKYGKIRGKRVVMDEEHGDEKAASTT
jgi:hypothetical protein